MFYTAFHRTYFLRLTMNGWMFFIFGWFNKGMFTLSTIFFFLNGASIPKQCISVPFHKLDTIVMEHKKKIYLN